MKCDLCENEATVFLTQIINGQMNTVNLCDACSKAKGVTDETGFGLAEAFLTPPQHGAGQETACPACGFTSAQLKKIGRMGCPECYTTFRQHIEGLLKTMHKGTRHIGKSPARPAEPLPVIVEPASPIPPAPAAPPPSLPALRAQLEQAVREERYEDAARIKASMDALQTGSEDKP